MGSQLRKLLRRLSALTGGQLWNPLLDPLRVSLRSNLWVQSGALWNPLLDQLREDWGDA